MVNQIVRLDLSQIGSPRIHRLHDYWESKRVAANAVPLRSQFDPTELRDLLPNILIVDVEQNPLRFRYRLVGTRVVESNNQEFTGRYLGTIGWQEEQQLIDSYTEAAVSGAPLCGRYTWRLRSGSSGECEFALFPFSSDGQTVTQIFAIEDYDFPKDDRRGRSRG